MRIQVMIARRILALEAAAAPAIGGDDRPNLNLIRVDDLGSFDLGGTGSSAIHTPILDRRLSRKCRRGDPNGNTRR